MGAKIIRVTKGAVNDIATCGTDLQFRKKCRDLDVEISQIPKGDRPLTFIRDYDGNLFEIK
jgi:hypothetical protein